MNKTPSPTSVSLLDREYLIACAPEDREELIAAALLLDQRMRDIRQNARSATPDRVAAIAALNITHEFLQLKKTLTQTNDEANDCMQKIKKRLRVVAHLLPVSAE